MLRHQLGGATIAFIVLTFSESGGRAATILPIDVPHPTNVTEVRFGGHGFGGGGFGHFGGGGFGHFRGGGFGHFGGFGFRHFAPHHGFVGHFTDLSSFTASTDLSSLTASTDIFSFAVLSSWGPLSTTPMVEGVRGCATARSSQEAHTGGSVTAGASAGKNVIMRCLLRTPPLVCGIPIYSAPFA